MIELGLLSVAGGAASLAAVWAIHHGAWPLALANGLSAAWCLASSITLLLDIPEETR